MSSSATPSANGRDNIRRRLAEGAASPLSTYRSLVYGRSSKVGFCLYELVTTLFGSFPGGLGYLLRKKCYPPFFKKWGQGVILGKNVTIRHPHRISIGDNVTIDDNCVLDGRGAGEAGLVLEDRVLVNRNCMLLAKKGPIHIAGRASIGANSVIVSTAGVAIGRGALFAGGCYLSAGSYEVDSPLPFIEQEGTSAGPISIGDNVWLGTRVTVLDGVTVGAHAVIGAHALVSRDIPDHSVAVGVPARTIRKRG